MAIEHKNLTFRRNKMNANVNEVTMAMMSDSDRLIRVERACMEQATRIEELSEEIKNIVDYQETQREAIERLEHKVQRETIERLEHKLSKYFLRGEE